METLEHMRQVVTDVVNAYATRVDAVSAIIAESYGGMDKARLEQAKICGQLQEALASSVSLRRRDFERMMGEIIAHQDQREVEVKEVLQETLEDQRRLAGHLKETIATSDLARVRAIQRQIESSMKHIKETIEQFHREHELLARKLTALLDNRDSLTVVGFKGVLRQIQDDLRIFSPGQTPARRAV